MSSPSRWSVGSSLLRVVVVLGASVLTLLAGCALGPEDQPDVVVGAASTAASSTATDATQVPLTVQVYLLRGDRLVRVSRSVPPGSGLGPSLAGLFLDLTPSEVADGLRTSVPRAATPPHGRLVGPIAEITMPTGFDRLSVREQIGAMSQIVFTVTANTVATEVQLVTNGRDLPVPDGNGRLLTRAVNPADYATWAPSEG